MKTMENGDATAVRERPIILSAESVRAVLAGRKTQTRRVVKPQPAVTPNGSHSWEREDGRRIPNGPRSAFGGRAVSVDGLIGEYCPYGRPGSRLWARETWAPIGSSRPSGYWTDPRWIGRECWYAADSDKPTWGGAWRSPMFMPRKLSRLTLELTAVRVERVCDISEPDAEAEGVTPVRGARCVGGLDIRGDFYRDGYALVWDAPNAARGFPWSANPWVWVLTFTIVPQPEAARA